MIKRMETLDDLHNIIIYNCNCFSEKNKIWIEVECRYNTVGLIYSWGFYPALAFARSSFNNGYAFIRSFGNCFSYEISAHDLAHSMLWRK